MKIDFLKLGNFLRVGTSVLFAVFAVICFIGVLKGNYLHIISIAGFLSMAYCVLKEWE